MTRIDYSKRKVDSSRSPWQLVLWGGLLIILLVCGWLLFGGRPQPDTTRQEPDAVLQEQLQSREITLYFSAEDGSHLLGEVRSVKGCQDEAACIKSVVEALIAGSEEGAVEVLPAGSGLLGLSVEGSLVSLDFDAGFVSGHPGGTQSELLTVYALANSLAVNFPHLRQVRLLVEGAPLETIKGHVDLRQAVTPDFSLVEEGSAPAGDLSNVPARSE